MPELASTNFGVSRPVAHEPATSWHLGWTGHKLRHRYASRGYAATRDMMAVQQALGHSSPAVTQRYVHVPSDAVRAVSDAA